MMNAMVWKQAIGVAACAAFVAGAGVTGAVAVRRDFAAPEPAGMAAQSVSFSAVAPANAPEPSETGDAIKNKSFPMRFRSRTRLPDGSYRFGLNMDGRTYFAQLGESVQEFEVSAFDERFEEQVLPGSARPRKVDVSVLTLKRGDKLIPLVLNRLVEISESPLAKPAREGNKRETLEAKMKRIMLPEIDFRQADIRDVVNMLRETSAMYDTDGEAGGRKGVNIILRLRDTDEPPQITFSATNFDMLEVIKILTQIAGLTYRVTDNAVIIEARPAGPFGQDPFGP